MKSKRIHNRSWNTVFEKIEKIQRKYRNKNAPDEMKQKPRWRQKLRTNKK